MHLLAIIANLKFQDVLDVFFLTIVAYHLYLWFRGTKGRQGIGRALRFRHYIHSCANLGAFPNHLGVSDLLASPGDPTHHPLSIGDSAGA